MKAAIATGLLAAAMTGAPTLAEDMVLVAWGDARSCAGVVYEDDETPPRHAVPQPWFIGEGRIEHGSTFCLLTDSDGEPMTGDDIYAGTYHARCDLGSPDETRDYTIAMSVENSALTMIWTVDGAGPAYPAKIGPFKRCDGREHPVTPEPDAQQ